MLHFLRRREVNHHRSHVPPLRKTYIVLT
jgi:hypothetical protein